MGDDYIEYLMARARMWQHHEWARRLRDIAQAEKVAGDRRTRRRQEPPTRWSLASLFGLLVARRSGRAARRAPVHQDT